MFLVVVEPAERVWAEEEKNIEKLCAENMRVKMLDEKDS